jgi:glycosyltransferase involved in cell wall biosynthesis
VFERRLLASAAESWMVSETDLLAARELCPPAHLRYVPNVVDVAAIVPVSHTVSEQRAVFVANFAYEPNRNGLRFLLDDVLPLVWRELPDARLALVGGGLDRPASEDARIETLGFAPDLAHIYAQASCALAPLLQGGGTPLKLIEALAYGVPVIATQCAVAGLEVRDGEHCLVADGAAEFASALVAVLRDERSAASWLSSSATRHARTPRRGFGPLAAAYYWPRPGVQRTSEAAYYELFRARRTSVQPLDERSKTPAESPKAHRCCVDSRPCLPPSACRSWRPARPPLPRRTFIAPRPAPITPG